MESVVARIPRHNKWSKEFITYLKSLELVICKKEADKHLGSMKNVLSGDMLPAFMKKLLPHIKDEINDQDSILS